MSKHIYYSVHVSQRGREKWRWSEPCESAKEALRIAKGRLEDQQAVLAFVVEFGPGGKTILTGSILPRSARKIIENFCELEDLLAD